MNPRWLLSIPVYLLLDAPYLWLFSAMHAAQIRRMTGGDQPSLFWPAAVLFYLLAPLAATYLVFSEARTIREAVTRGAVLGALMYGTWDLTSLAILGPQRFSPAYAALDITWGATVVALLMLVMSRILQLPW